MLRPFASLLWWSAAQPCPAGTREHLLPTGQMHLVMRLDGPPLRVFAGAQDIAGSIIDEPVIGGARTRFYVKEKGAAVTSIGVQLLPGAARALFGPGAGELADAHTGLSALWGADAQRMLGRVSGAGSPGAQLRMLDALLCARLDAAHAAPVLPAQVAQALREMGAASRIDALVRASRYSHRAFIALFRDATGMSPKRYARVQRFQSVLQALHASPAVPLAQLAFDAGYSDQSHMAREFLAFAGVSPGAYRTLAPQAAHHVVLPVPGQIHARRGRGAGL